MSMKIISYVHRNYQPKWRVNSSFPVEFLEVEITIYDFIEIVCIGNFRSVWIIII